MSPGDAFVFGKLPTHGDFVARGLSPSAREAWDDWLSATLDADRVQLGHAFEEIHDVAPVWRFVDEPNVGRPGWRAGALAPSIDAVGRRFFVIAGRDGLSEAEAGDHGEALAEAMAQLIYEAFAGGWTVDDLTRAAAAADAPVETAAGTSARGRWWCAPSADADLVVVEGSPSTLIALAAAPVVLETVS